MTVIPLRDFWRNAANMALISQTHIGLSEKIAELDRKIKNACQAIFFTGVVSTLIIGVSLNKYIKVILIGSALIKIFCTYLSINQNQLIRSASKSWLAAFQHLAKGEYENAEKLLKSHVDFMTEEDDSEILKPNSKKALAVLSLHEGGLPVKDVQPPSKVVGHALLMILCHRANQGLVCNSDLNICANFFLPCTDSGLSDAYSDVFKSIANLDTTDFSLPLLTSPGHGILVAVWKAHQAFDLDKDFNERGELCPWAFRHMGNLAGWKGSICKAKEAMQKANVYGQNEEAYVEDLLRASTLREFTIATRTITSDQRRLLYLKMLSFPRSQSIPSPTKR